MNRTLLKNCQYYLSLSWKQIRLRNDTSLKSQKLNLAQSKVPILILISLLIATIGFLILNLILGSVAIPFTEIMRILLGGESSQETWTNIILKFRLPKAITAILAGSALAVSGLQMQTLFQNPLAGPFVLGINSGASLGVALVVLATVLTGNSLLFASLGILQDLSLIVAASMGAALVLGIVLFVSRYVANNTTLLILGLMFGYATSSLVTILLHFSDSERIQAYLRWTFGSFGGVTNQQLPIFTIVIVMGLMIAYLLAKSLNLLLLGETYAQSLGLKVKIARIWLIISSALLAGTVTAFCGPISFLGVAVPHLGRALLRSADHRLLLPAVTMMGAILALIADIVAQLPGSQLVLPLNAVTSLIGTPIVTWVILKRSHR